MELVLTPEQKKSKWKASLQSFIEKSNNIVNRKNQLDADAKKLNEDDNMLNVEFKAFCKDVTGKDKSTFFDVMMCLND